MKLASVQSFGRWIWAFLLLQAIIPSAVSAAEALPSWNDGVTKQSIVSFVQRVTQSGGKDFVAPAERIAVFDNDGTLWSEQPMYFQLLFAFDRLRALAPAHPEWQERPVLKAVLAGDMKGAMAEGEKGLVEVVMATHTGPLDDFAMAARSWIDTARHPKTRRAYTEMTYQPMRELLDYLRANGFKTFIVSGGDVEFMRVWAESAYGIPPEQVIGSRLALALESRDGRPVVIRLPKIDVHNDKEAKTLSIVNYIGRRPILAFGNSDGDHAMLQWTAAGNGARLMGLVHHTDGDREVAYDRTSSIGRLDKALDDATARGWTIADMKRDWKQVFPTETK